VQKDNIVPFFEQNFLLIQILYMLPGKLKEDMYFITSDYVGLNWIHPGEALNIELVIFLYNQFFHKSERNIIHKN